MRQPFIFFGCGMWDLSILSDQGSNLFPLCSFNPRITREVPTGHHLRMIGFVFLEVQEDY